MPNFFFFAGQRQLCGGFYKILALGCLLEEVCIGIKGGRRSVE
jgi:hypothetical protein